MMKMVENVSQLTLEYWYKQLKDCGVYPNQLIANVTMTNYNCLALHFFSMYRTNGETNNSVYQNALKKCQKNYNPSWSYDFGDIALVCKVMSAEQNISMQDAVIMFLKGVFDKPIFHTEIVLCNLKIEIEAFYFNESANLYACNSVFETRLFQRIEVEMLNSYSAPALESFLRLITLVHERYLKHEGAFKALDEDEFEYLVENIRPVRFSVKKNSKSA